MRAWRQVPAGEGPAHKPPPSGRVKAREPTPGTGERARSRPPDVPEQRPGEFELTGQAGAVGGGNLELTQRHGWHLAVILELDLRGNFLARVIVLRVQPILGQLLDLRVF